MSAARLYGAAPAGPALFESMNVRLSPYDGEDFEQNRRNVEAALGEAKFRSWYEKGSGMSLEEAVRYALGQVAGKAQLRRRPLRRWARLSTLSPRYSLSSALV